jgi:chemotaxis protein MotB
VAKKKNKILDLGGDNDGGSELWLVSYADLMTLIACFFIMMMVFANFEEAGVVRKVKQISEHFKRDTVDQERTKVEDLEIEIKKMVTTDQKIQESTGVEMKKDFLQISFKGNLLFESGRVTLKKEALVLVDSIIAMIKRKDPRFRIIVEGHTDNSKVTKKSKYRSNWELSSARAATVIHRFEKMNFNNKNLVSIGYADTRPVVPNQDNNLKNIKENQDINRRVVIKVLEPINIEKRFKLGFGLIYKEKADNFNRLNIDEKAILESGGK